MPRDDAVAAHDIGVVRGAFGHEAVFDHPGIIAAGLLGHHLAHRRVQQLNRLDVAPPPTDVRNGNHLHPGLRGGVFGQARLGLGEQNQRRGRGGGVREGKIAVAGRAARDLKIDQPFIHAVGRHQLAVDRQQLVIRHRRGHVQFCQRPGQAFAMAGKVDELAAQHACHLINAIGHKEAAVEDADLGVFLGQIGSVHIDGAAHSIYPHRLGSGGWMPASSNCSG